MTAIMMMESPWKTTRPKRGTRILEIEPGDVIRIGAQAFRVAQKLKNGKFLVRNVVGVRTESVLMTDPA
jgi:hypothetical protein